MEPPTHRPLVIGVGGRGANIQDGAVLHADPGLPCTLGDRVTVGHGAIVHGATVGGGSLIGMGARVVNGASIGERCIVAAGALVPEGFTAPPGVPVSSSPARVRRDLCDSELELLRDTAAGYAANARRHRDQLAPSPGAGRPDA